VRFLWKSAARKKIFARTPCDLFARGAQPLVSYSASLVSKNPTRTIHIRSQQPHRRRLQPLSTLVHRFQESIAGRAYLIEVAAVDPDRWRACIVKAPGVPTALMPFYGPTPDHAAGLLRAWLTRAHAGAAGSARR